MSYFQQPVFEFNIDDFPPLERGTRSEFKRIVNDVLKGTCYIDVEDQIEQFDDVYEVETEQFNPDSGHGIHLHGRMICDFLDVRHIPHEARLSAMKAYIGTLSPAYTNIEPMQGLELRHFIELFRCTDANGRDVLFFFDLVETGFELHGMSVCGPIDLGETDRLQSDALHAQLKELRGLGLVELFFTLTNVLRTFELDRRIELLAAAAVSLANPCDKGLGSIGGDNLSLVALKVKWD
jgi:hypothetical protein